MSDRGRGRGGGGPRGRGDFGGRGRGDGGGRGRGRGDGGGFRGGRGGFGQPVKAFGDGTFPQPNATITKLEDASVKDVSVALAATSLTDRFPRRPGYGTQGRKIVLWTNYFELSGVKPKETYFYRYSVAFQPDNQIPKPKKKRLIQLLLQRAPFAEIPSASDWAQVLVTTKKIDLKGRRQAYDIEWYPADGEPLPPPAADESAQRSAARRRNTITVLVEEIGTVSLAELMKDLAGAGTTYPLKLETIQTLNIVLSYAPSTDLKIVTAGQNKFYPFSGHPQAVMIALGEGLEALRGYFLSVRTSVNRILVNANVATGAFYKAGPLLDLLTELGGAPQNPEQHRRLAAFVRKLRFETNYLPETDKDGKVKKGKGGPLRKRKVHTIGDLSPFGKHAQNITFNWTNPSGQSRNVTIEAYFQQTYQWKLRSPRAPLVNYGTGNEPKWIPAELCTVLPGQLARRLLLPNQTRNMIEFAARQPFQNAESIVGDGLKVTKINPVSQGLNTNLTKFGIKVSPNMLTVHGRILDPPTLRYNKDLHKPQDGGWNLGDARSVRVFFQPAPLPSWNTLVINKDQRETIFGSKDAVMSLLGDFKKTLNRYGIAAGPVQQPGLARINTFDLQTRNVDKLRGTLQQAIRGFPKRPGFLFVILPDDNALLYDCIKFVCDIQLGIPSVCNIGQKLAKEKGQMQYMANVALKFNQKQKGVNHYISPEELKPLDARTIVFGIDVTHPSPGSAESSPSIAGVVASVDTKFTQYPASIRTQKGRQEMVAGLEEMIVERMKLWSAQNKGLPDKVIVYRDGVSEGQYRIVMEEEYPAFVSAFDKLYGGSAKHPKISIIVVGKRHHTRFYPTTTQDADRRTGNPLPGTVVDRGVTGEKLFDFFLLAHKGLQGTSKPAHYVVLKDENKLGADQLQKLTHNLCYTFARATRAVSICPPAYYADLLCERGRSYLHGVLKGDGSVAFTAQEWQRDVHPNLADTMFYL